MVVADADEASGLWRSMVEMLKEHIHYKRRKFKEICRIADSLTIEEILIHLNYSKNYKSKHQNEIQRAYFSNKLFSLFIACTYYQNCKLPITITSEESDKSRVISLSCVNKVITHSLEKLNQHIKTVYIVGEGCASQFRWRYVFNLLTHIHPRWHYNKAHHGKDPMDGTGGTVKNLVYQQSFISKCSYQHSSRIRRICKLNHQCWLSVLDKSEFIQKPEEVSKATPISSTLKVHKVSHVRNGSHSFSNQFFKLSEHLEPFHVETYGVQCAHSANNINDESLCNNCYKRCIIEEEWLKCPVCYQLYHEDCFYI